MDVSARHMLPEIVGLFDAVDSDGSGEIVIEDRKGKVWIVFSFMLGQLMLPAAEVVGLKCDQNLLLLNLAGSSERCMHAFLQGAQAIHPRG